MSYRKYDPMVKSLIIRTGNRNLFPELKIPRTTINYWLKSSKEPISSERNSTYEASIKQVQKENYELKATNLLISECLEKLVRELGGFDKKSKENRKFIIETIESFKGLIPLKKIIEIIGIGQTTYYRWRVEVMGCKYNQRTNCRPASPLQLTKEEQEIIIKYATKREFKKFSTISLMHYCKRKNILHASLESWYKYINMYDIKRRAFKNKRKRYGVGIRAKASNKIWHIDITELKYGGNEKAYLQLLVDNYSRLIIGWKLNQHKKMDVTYKTILKAFHFAPDFKGSLISDKGTENTGSLPQKLLKGRGIKQLVAKHDIRFSNSMVEAVFRQLKQKFYLKESKTFKALYQQIYRFVRQYNYVIPHSTLEGATPIEKFRESFDLIEYRKVSKLKIIESRRKRRELYKKCTSCIRKYRSVTISKHVKTVT